MHAQLYGLAHNTLVGRGRDHHHGHVAVAGILAQAVEQIDPTGIGHTHVAQHQVCQETLIQCRKGGLRAVNLVHVAMCAQRGQNLCQGLTRGGFVVNHQNVHIGAPM